MAGTPLRVAVSGNHAAFCEALAFLLDREPDLEVVHPSSVGGNGRPSVVRGAADVTIVNLAPAAARGAELGDLRSTAARGTTVTLAMGEVDRERAIAAGARSVVDKSGALADVLGAVRAAGAPNPRTAQAPRAAGRPYVADAFTGGGRVSKRLLEAGERRYPQALA